MKRLIVLLLMTLAPAMVRSEFFIGDSAPVEPFLHAYGGATFSTSGTLKTEVWDSGSGTASTKTELSDGSMFVLGLVRTGVWMTEYVPFLGGALDMSYMQYSSDTANTEITGLSISFLVMARAPMFRSDELPEGRLRPYIGVGPCVITGSIDTDAMFPGGSTARAETAVEGGAGFDVRAGLEWQLSRRVGAFLEYRYLDVSFEGEK